MKIKTFFNTISILIILSFLGFIFYLGLEQTELNENIYGVVYTKTTGWKNSPIVPNRFSWSFEKVIPNIYTMHKFRILTHNLVTDSSAHLPSHTLYAASSSVDPENFLYRYKVNINFRFNIEYLVEMTRKGSITMDNFEDWERLNKERINQEITSFIQMTVNNNQLNNLNLKSEIIELLNKRFPYYNFFDISINLIKPDLDLYNLTRSRYLKNLKLKTEAEKDIIKKRLNLENNETLKLELLKKYGEVFTQYPIMIEYLKVDRDNKFNLAEFNDFIETQNQK